MLRSERMYYNELESILNVHFRVLREELRGKGCDGITAAQKKKLHSLGVNVTGIRYKGTAYQIIRLLESRKKEGKPSILQLRKGITDETLQITKKIYRVKKLTWQIVHRKPVQVATMSPELFSSESDAEYYAAKRVVPEDDVVIISYTPQSVWAVVGKTIRYFPSEENAKFIQKRFGGELLHYHNFE